MFGLKGENLDRMQQVQFTGGELWGELNTAFNFPKDPTQVSANAWFKIHPRVHNSHIAGADITNEGYVALAGNFLLYPAIQANPDGSAAMVFTLSGPTFFASAAYALLSRDEHSFGPIKVAAPGSDAYDPNATRWGTTPLPSSIRVVRAFGWQPSIFHRLRGRPSMVCETGGRASSRSAPATSSGNRRV